MDFVDPKYINLVQGLLVLVVGTLLARLIANGAARMMSHRTTPQQSMLVRRFGFYALMTLVVMMALRQLGFDLSILLGAAGILTVALGFASQTSASNLISGIFLIGERPFVIGDVIRVGTTTGTVESLDLMSVKIRTFDNLLVRVPNETLLKAEITNLTHFPIRRFDAQIRVAHRADIGKVREVLLEVAAQNTICLDEPAPLIIFLGFEESAMTFQFSVWAANPNYLLLRNSIQEEIKAAFDAAGIEIPFPQRALHTGKATEPFPVRLVGGAGEQERSG